MRGQRMRHKVASREGSAFVWLFFAQVNMFGKLRVYIFPLFPDIMEKNIFPPFLCFFLFLVKSVRELVRSGGYCAAAESSVQLQAAAG